VSNDGGETVINVVYLDNVLIAGKTDKKMSEVRAANVDHFKVETWVNYIIS